MPQRPVKLDLPAARHWRNLILRSRRFAPAGLMFVHSVTLPFVCGSANFWPDHIAAFPVGAITPSVTDLPLILPRMPLISAA